MNDVIRTGRVAEHEPRVGAPRDGGRLERVPARDHPGVGVLAKPLRDRAKERRPAQPSGLEF
jgi:hypothetical protein